jgi:hypothetical protein
VLTEKVLPHVQLLVRKMRNGHLEFHYQVSQIPIAVDQPPLLNHMLHLFGRNPFPSHRLLSPIQMLKNTRKTKERLLERNTHQIHQIVAFSRPLLRRNLHHCYLEIGRSAN